MRRSSSRRIPEELHIEILSRLPVKSILRCKSVCKSWFSLISDPNFVKKHLDFTIQNNSRCSSLMLGGDTGVLYFVICELESPSLNEIRNYVVEIEDYPFKISGYRIHHLVGSCNGLVCLMFHDVSIFATREDEFFCLWNPATKEFKKIPESPNRLSRHETSIDAFVYDPQNEDYKLVLVGINYGSVYTLGSNSWKTVPTFAYSWITCGDEVLFSGNIYWLAMPVLVDGVIILSMDICDEKFKEIKLPAELLESECSWIITAGVLEGCFSLLVKVEQVCVEVWVMQDHGDRESWAKRYTITNEMINHFQCLKIMWNFKNGKILFMDNGRLILYDPKHGNATERMSRSLAGDTSEKKYSGTLVSLNSGTYVGRGQIEESIESPATTRMRSILDGASSEDDV